LFCSVVLLVSASTPAQCGGRGEAVLEIISKDNAGIGPGNLFTVRLIGTPDSPTCFVCDFGRGPQTIQGLGTLCLDLSKSKLEFPVWIPKSGVAAVPAILGSEFLSKQLCSQWVGLDTNNQLIVSNAVCFEFGGKCESEIASLGHCTGFTAPSSYPVTIVSAVRDSNGQLEGKVEVSFDPKKPVSFPVGVTGSVIFEKIVEIRGTVVVLSRIDTSKLKSGKLGADTILEVTAGTKKNSVKVHTSCSKPLGVGFELGVFAITDLQMTPKK